MSYPFQFLHPCVEQTSPGVAQSAVEQTSTGVAQSAVEQTSTGVAQSALEQTHTCTWGSTGNRHFWVMLNVRKKFLAHTQHARNIYLYTLCMR